MAEYIYGVQLQMHKLQKSNLN